MAETLWLFDFGTFGKRPLLRAALNRDLFTKTLNILETKGSLQVEKCVFAADRAKLVVRLTREGPIVAAELKGMSERIMQLACRVEKDKFWSEEFSCRLLDCEEAGRWRKNSPSIVASLL